MFSLEKKSRLNDVIQYIVCMYIDTQSLWKCMSISQEAKGIVRQRKFLRFDDSEVSTLINKNCIKPD